MKKVSAIAALAALAGCAYVPSVGPDYDEPKFEDVEAELPDAGKPPEMENDDRVEISSDTMQLWWKQFDDAVLDQLLEAAVGNNLNFKTAQKRLEEANWALRGTYSEFLPKVGAEGGWTDAYNRMRNQSLAGSGIKKHHSQVAELGAGVNWEIDIFGGSRRATEAALALAEGAEWDLANAWLQLTTQIGEQYVSLRTCQERIAVAQDNLKLQTETYEILKSRLDSGIGDELAVNQCKYVVEQTRARIPQLLAQEERLKNALTILAGEMPGVLHDTLKPVEQRRDWLLAPQKLESLPLDMIRAGYGDIVGKYSSLNDWRLSRLMRGEYFCPEIHDLVFEVTNNVRDLAERIAERDDEAIAYLTKALILIGITLSLVGSTRPGSGSEHHLSHFFEITSLLEGKPHFCHGIDVAYAAVVTAELRERIDALKEPEFCPEPETDRVAAWQRIYGRIAGEVRDLQAKAGSYLRDMADAYRENWDDVKAILADCPTADACRTMLTRAGYPLDAFEEMYGRQKIRDAVFYGKDLKDRYSVLWLYYELFSGRKNERQEEV